MDALITAGGIPQIDQHLYEITQGGYKVLIDILGKPMIQWVLDALSESKEIGDVIVAGLPVDTPLKFKRKLTIIENQGDLFDNIRAGAVALIEKNPEIRQAIIISGDIPAVQGHMLDWMVTNVEKDDLDFYYTVVEKSVVEKTFPGAKRSYTKLKDVEVCGGDVIGFRPQILVTPNTRFHTLIEARKNVLKQAGMLGFDNVLLMLFHMMTLKEAEHRVASRLKISGKVFLSPFAEIGMDVDKTFQLNLVRDFLNKRLHQ
jgi:GTP:adenosylcobinamide-phosphate guanylyltransferase